jgi:glycosyltransferase involved in cell wall biosynthesis
MPDPRVSILILAKNEAQNLPDCLDSVRWADEVVVVVDPESRDDTEAVARRGATVVAVRAFEDFASQRNAALALATGDWVFALDADERVTPELASEIRRMTSVPGPGHDGYRVPIRSVILGRPFSFSGTQHDRPLRLFRRGKGRWVGTVHETVDLRGSVGVLRHELSHKTLNDMKTFLRKIDEYTTLEAEAFERQGRRLRSTDLSVRPAWTFLKLYLGKAGFRDGPEGFVFCALSGVSVAIRSWKYRELVRARGTP